MSDLFFAVIILTTHIVGYVKNVPDFPRLLQIRKRCINLSQRG